MTTRPAQLLLSALVMSLAALPLLAQDQFGRAVHVSDAGEVLVLQPNAGRGPATLMMFRRAGDGTWHVVDRVRPEDAVQKGQALNPSLVLGEGTMLIAAGDPDARIGAYEFRRDSDGAWVEHGSIPSGAAADSGSGGGQISLGAIMRILQPPRRVVALDGDRAVVALLSGRSEARGVRVFTRATPADRWEEEGRLISEGLDARDQYGAALALAGDHLLVGAPRHGESGAVFVFRHDRAAGGWREAAKLTRADSAPGSLFGAAIAMVGDTALIGAPGTRDVLGAIVAYARDADGNWEEVSRIMPGEPEPGDQFGAAFAVASNELWVGAPRAAERSGRIYRFLRDGTAGEWRQAPAPPLSGVEPGYVLGLSLALGPDVAVAGAPAADGGLGRAAVFTRSEAGDWSTPAWLSAGDDLATVSGAEIPCANGRALQFACGNVDLLAFLPIKALGGASGESVSDTWGWTDPETGREYALVGRSGGAAFVDVTDPSAPVYLGIMEANESGARDLKVYRDHLFLTGDGAGNHGLLVFDLTRLRAVATPPVAFEPDTVYHEIASAHNLVIDTESGFAFPVGASGGGQTCGGGLHMVDIREPTQPTFAGCYTDTEGLIWPGRTHDAQCVVYRGPDEAYRGRQICFASNETALRIVDVTDKQNPVPVSAATYPGIAYVHQGWLTEDQRHFYLDDELDELVGQTDRTRTLIWDVADLDDPVLLGEFLGPNGATDHNLFIKGDLMYQANYQAGFRVIDISNREQPVEIGYFDTTPYEGDPPGFNGAWTAFPFFDSGTVIVSSMHEGLFILKPRRQELVP